MGSGGRVRDLPRRGRGANRPDVSRRVAAVAAWGAVDGRPGEVQGVRLRSSARRASCSRGQTPAPVHWAGRRQQVIPEPKPSYCGRRSQAIPVCRTNRMPWNTSRSGYLLRPGCKRRRPENLRRAAPGVTNAPRAPLPTRASQKAKARPLEEPVPAGVSGTTPRRIAPPARMPWSLCPLPGLQHRRRERRRLRPGSVEFRTGCTAASGVGTRRQAHRQRGRSGEGSATTASWGLRAHNQPGPAGPDHLFDAARSSKSPTFFGTPNSPSNDRFCNGGSIKTPRHFPHFSDRWTHYVPVRNLKAIASITSWRSRQRPPRFGVWPGSSGSTRAHCTSVNDAPGPTSRSKGNCLADEH